jgi:hypothetical protein
VDEGAGLLLVGFASMLALPLPPSAASILGANWLVVLSLSPAAFRNAEVDWIVSRAWTLCRDNAGREGGARSVLVRRRTSSQQRHEQRASP